MKDTSIISIASTLFFIACSAIQVYVTLRIVKIEKNILEHVRREIDQEIGQVKHDLRREFKREIEILERELNHLRNNMK
jgi:ribosomal protein S13